MKNLPSLSSRIENPKVSVAIPLFNEQDVFAELLARVLGVLDIIPGGPHEVVLVDDGSKDNTLALILDAREKDERIVAVPLSRNFGHQIALTAAIDNTSGDVIIMMDGDLQDRPEVIPELIQSWRDGADIVYAVRASRKENYLLRICYFTFYRVINLLTSEKLPEDSGDFSLVSREVVDVMKKCRERHRYLRGLRSWAGFRQVPHLIERDARVAGKSKYGWKQLFSLAFDGILSFSTIPLRFAIWIGIATTIATSGLAIFWVVAWSMNFSPPGFTALATSIAFFGGVQLIFLGIIGEYVGRIYEEVKRRPLYIQRYTEFIESNGQQREANNLRS